MIQDELGLLIHRQQIDCFQPGEITRFDPSKGLNSCLVERRSITIAKRMSSMVHVKQPIGFKSETFPVNFYVFLHS